VPTSSEHMKKYQINKEVIDNALDVKNKQHFDWIATICFYASLHIIEAKFAEKSIDNYTHKERENNMRSTPGFSRKLCNRYKTLSDYSRVARYGPGLMDLTRTSYSLQLLKSIEKEMLNDSST